MVDWRIDDVRGLRRLVIGELGDVFDTEAHCTEIEQASAAVDAVVLNGVTLILGEPLDAALWRACLSLARGQL